MKDEQEINRIFSEIAENINKGLTKKNRIFENWANDIEELINQIGWTNITSKLNEKLTKPLGQSTYKTMYYRIKNENQPITQKITSSLPSNIRKEDIKSKVQKNVTNSSDIEYKDIWKNQFQIDGERCMKKLENLGLTPQDVEQWGIVGDNLIMNKIAEIETQKRK